MDYFAYDQCMHKGGRDEIFDVICCLFVRVSLNCPSLLQIVLGHIGKNDKIHYQPLDQIWKSGIKTLLNSLVLLLILTVFNVLACHYFGPSSRHRIGHAMIRNNPANAHLLSKQTEIIGYGIFMCCFMQEGNKSARRAIKLHCCYCPSP